MRFQGIASVALAALAGLGLSAQPAPPMQCRSEEHTSELQSQSNLVCRLLLEKKKKNSRSDTKTSKLNSPHQKIRYTAYILSNQTISSTILATVPMRRTSEVGQIVFSPHITCR